MSNTNFYKGFKDRYSYKSYHLESMELELLLFRVGEDEERGQISYWLKRDYISINKLAVRMAGYIRCLWDFDMIDEETFEFLYDVYSQLAREAKERIDELSEQE